MVQAELGLKKKAPEPRNKREGIQFIDVPMPPHARQLPPSNVHALGAGRAYMAACRDQTAAGETHMTLLVLVIASLFFLPFIAAVFICD